MYIMRTTRDSKQRLMGPVSYTHLRAHETDSYLVCRLLLEKKPNTIVYVSCNPSTLARDSKVLLENKYSLSNIVGLDLFPMTHHIESVASFKRI